MYWTQALSEDVLRQMIESSFCFGVYKSSSSTSTNPNATVNAPTDAQQQIGFVRLITDNILFAYLTDLYVLPEYQGLGLGRWLIDCVDEVLGGMPYLRWVMLRTSSDESKVAYERRLGMRVLAEEVLAKGVVMGRRGEGCMA